MFALTNLLWAKDYAGLRDRREMGLILGDPIAISVKIPVKERNFWDFRAGIWTWHFWHDQAYNTPYLSVDYGWLFPIEGSKRYYYLGTGLAFFLSDNPKDKRDYDACAAIRFPIGRELYNNEKDFSIVFEFAPIYQFAPAYSAKPYIIELNAGIMFRYSF